MDQLEVLTNIYQGSAIGLFVGDAFGRAVEGWHPLFIRKKYGILTNPLDGIYTDDTEMMIGLMESLLEKGDLDPDYTAKIFLKNFHPFRGYGRRIYGVMKRISDGLPWDKVGTDSWGNGAAMRIAPVGFFFYDDLSKLEKAAILSSKITHKHPNGIAGALAQALAVAIATSKAIKKEKVIKEEFIKIIIERVKPISIDMETELLKIKKLALVSSVDEKIDLVVKNFRRDVSAPGAVPAAIASFLLATDFKEAVIIAVNAGGDTDTIGAMAGSIAGAYWGFNMIPSNWFEVLEDDKKGKSYILGLAKHLAMRKLGIN
ncbi:MAG: hypothetical protein DRG20_02285 [Deltaproteobacteria bacterium]|nr:MAG: hypothetical protein DRG20_02285 [Deltaproteobacteria bacterium]